MKFNSKPVYRKASAEKNIAFIQKKVPHLPSGEYRVEVKQEISHKQAGIKPIESGQGTSRYEFSVRGERFRLNAADLDHVFPPDESQGDFENVLPHIAFMNHTFPWERSLEQKPAGKGEKENQASWLALLSFDAADQATSQDRLTVLDLVPNSMSVKVKGEEKQGKLPIHFLSYPKLARGELEEGELFDEQIQTIDISVSLFSSIAPSSNDLAWAAHVRQTGQSGKELVTRAIVMGNRLPCAGNRTKVHLVSLEGMNEYLPDNAGTPANAALKGFEYVRLISLFSWTFYTQKTSHSFASILEAVNVDSLQVPAQSSNETPSNPGLMAQYARNALRMGYVALHHSFRFGGSSVSWYRSPLAAVQTTPHQTELKHSSDGAVHYDPQTGLLDVSLACAWQLGRMLAIRNKSFIAKLLDLRRTKQRKAVLHHEHSILINKFAGLLPHKVELAVQSESSQIQDLLHSLIKRALQLGQDSEKKETKS